MVFALGDIHTPIPRAAGSTLLPALRTAIESQDLEACRQLQRMGCPLNKPIRSCGVCTPLLYVLGYHDAEDLPTEIIHWLLQNDGSVWTELCAVHNRRLKKGARVLFSSSSNLRATTTCWRPS